MSACCMDPINSLLLLLLLLLFHMRRPVCGGVAHSPAGGWAGSGSGPAQGQLHAAVLQVCYFTVLH
jgi:hypothetical protein